MARGFGRRRRGTAGAGGASSPLQGTLAVSRSAVTLRAFTLATLTSTDAVAISNTAGGALRGPTIATTYGSGSGWLTATLESTAAGWDINLSASAASLTVATYTATVTVSDGNASNSGAVTVAVTFEVVAPPAVLKLQYSTMDSFDAALAATSSTPASDTVTVSNIGGAGTALFGPYVEGVDVVWLNAVITGSGPTYTLTITPNADIAALASGRHFGVVRVADAYGGAADLTVLVDIAGAAGTPSLNLTPNALAFSALEGGSNPANQTSTISNNGGGGSLAGPTASTLYTGSSSGWCTATVTGAGPTYTLTAAISTTGLAAGTHTANITVADANCTQTASCAVTLDLTPIATTNPVLAVAPAPSGFTYRINGTLPADQTASITNSGTGNLAGPTATSDVTWMAPTVTNLGNGTWTLTFRCAPAGLAAGSYSGTVTVADANAASTVQIPVTLAVTAAATGGYTAPRFALCEGVTFNTATGFLEGQPTGIRRQPPSNLTAAATHTVTTGAQFTTALAASASQDHPVIEITAGSTVTGNFTFPVRTGAGFLVIRSSGYAALTMGTRLDPVADAASLATIRTTNSTPVINQRTVDASGMVWVEGLVITGTVANSNALVNLRCLTESDDANLTHDVYFSHCHFDGIRDVVRGVQWCGIRLGIYDSYLDGFEKVGQECQAILTTHSGQYYFADNCYLEACGENFMAGGSAMPSNLNRWMPRDMYFKHCEFDTRAEWNPQHASYNGDSNGFKNLWELKRGLRVTVDGCYFTHSYPSAQTGQPLVIKSVCQGALNQTENRTEDITIHLCLFRASARHGWEVLGNSAAKGGEQPAQRVQFLDCLGFETNIHPYDMTTSVSWTLGATSNSRDVVIEHCTLAQSGGTIPSQASSVGTAANVTIIDNVFPQGTYGFTGTGAAEGLPSLNKYWTGYTVTGNVMFGGSTSTNYPAGNFFPASEAAVGFVNSTGTTPADYKLASTSTYAGVLGQDGRQIGCDIDRLITRTTGVY